MAAVELVAHRGCADRWPENTVRAVRESARRLPAVEVDVRRCGTGELVAFHDERVDAVTGGQGRVAELPWSTLRALRVAGSGEPIASLEEVVEAVPPGVTLQVELKERGLADDVLARLPDDLDARLSSFDPGALAELAPDPPVPTGLLFRDDPESNLATATDLDCANVHPHWELSVESTVVEDAHGRGFRVIAWGAGSDPDAVVAAREAGVDGLTVDRPDVGPG